jgi:hypothetical protein
MAHLLSSHVTNPTPSALGFGLEVIIEGILGENYHLGCSVGVCQVHARIHSLKNAHYYNPHMCRSEME